MSTAEAVSVYYQTMISGYYYGNKTMDIDCLVQNLTGAISKENRDDLEKVKRRFKALLISFTPLSRVLAVPITLNPGAAKRKPSSPSSGIFKSLSLKTLIRLS